MQVINYQKCRGIQQKNTNSICINLKGFFLQIVRQQPKEAVYIHNTAEASGGRWRPCIPCQKCASNLWACYGPCMVVLATEVSLLERPPLLSVDQLLPPHMCAMRQPTCLPNHSGNMEGRGRLTMVQHRTARFVHKIWFLLPMHHRDLVFMYG